MTLAELKKGLLELMSTIYPNTEYKYYAMDVVEGFQRPCFFTQLKPVDTDPNNYNTRNNKLTFYIDYFQLEVDEADMLDKIDKLRNLFGLSINISNRAVKVSGYEWDFVGTERNVAEIRVDLQWSDLIPHDRTAPLIEHVETEIETEE